MTAAREAAQSASEIIARHAAGTRESVDKGPDSPVTLADLEADEAIRQRLHRSFPDDPILSEETRDTPAREAAERIWVVDPLDGTKEFIEGVPEFAISIALVLRGEPVVGVVMHAPSRECFWGAQGEGAFAGEQPLGVSSTARLSEAVALVSRSEQRRGQLAEWSGWFRELRPVGSVALKLAWIAAGRGDLWISAAPKSEWDVCAGDLLVREAGGRFVCAASGPRVYNQRDVLLEPPMLAGPPALLDEFSARGCP